MTGWEKKLAEKGKLSHKAAVMAESVKDALTAFCNSDAEFAQAVEQGGTFAECMESVASGVGPSISDLKAYQKAVSFYFPGATVRFRMEIDLCGSVKEEAAPKTQTKILNLSDFW